MNTELNRRISAHYEKPQLQEIIDGALKQAGADPRQPDIDSTAGVDEFHIAGKVATLAILDSMDLSPGMHVLDAGCGIGGAARTLARRHGCQVRGIDLTPGFISVAEALTRRMGLEDQCSFNTGSVTDLDHADASFDAAITFHVAMNIPDRLAFYREIMRVLKPGGQFCCYDIASTGKPGIQFPVPWASSADCSFLKGAAETRSLLEEAGFVVTQERSMTKMAKAFYAELDRKNEEEGPSPVSLALIIDGDAQAKLENAIGAMNAGIIEPVLFIARK